VGFGGCVFPDSKLLFLSCCCRGKLRILRCMNHSLLCTNNACASFHHLSHLSISSTSLFPTTHSILFFIFLKSSLPTSYLFSLYHFILINLKPRVVYVSLCKRYFFFFHQYSPLLLYFIFYFSFHFTSILQTLDKRNLLPQCFTV